MTIKRKPKGCTEIDVSAFSDIAFLLIIFFILTTSLARIAGTTVDIPAGQPPKDQAKEEDKVKTINLSATQIRYGSEENAPALTMEELREKLILDDLRNKPTDMERMVIIECSDDVEYERYFQVLTAVSKAGGVVAILEQDEETQ